MLTDIYSMECDLERLTYLKHEPYLGLMDWFPLFYQYCHLCQVKCCDPKTFQLQWNQHFQLIGRL